MTDRLKQAREELETAEKNWRRVQSEFKREKRRVPKHIYALHTELLGTCRGNIVSATAAEQAMRCYPPLEVR